ncbi:ATP-binding protein [Ponticoccus sp. (in: a-proteobacteria)]|uniref:ATP-binding protein n=1 Tax=Ponticoccus sp. (in: a-proteobacteria) TaxID=1925025 RepID=UPI003AB2A2BA
MSRLRDWFRDFGVRIRLSAALAVMFGLMLLVSVIGLRVLDRTEVWMNVLHRDTLTEVAAAMDLSRDASDLATSAPFLFALFAPYQLEQEVAKVMANLDRVQHSSESDPALDLPLSRLRSAIEDLAQALLPQSARQAELKAIDRALVRLNARSRRMARDTALPLEARQDWSALQQLTAVALGAARAEELIELGEFSRDFQRQSQALRSLEPEDQRRTFDEISEVVQRGTGLFVLKHGHLSARLDAESALFRIRQETHRVNAFAETKVAQAEDRLSRARAATSDTLAYARNAFLALILASLVVAVTSSFYVSRHVARNLERISGAMRRLASGNLRVDLPDAPTSRDEIGQLFTAFGVFRDNARKLDRRTAQIRHQNALFSRVFQNIKDGVAVEAEDGRIIAENENLRRLLRLPPGSDRGGDRMSDLVQASPFSRAAGGEERGGFEEYGDADGNVIEIHLSPLPDGGQVWLISATTERKRIEARLEAIRRVEALGKVSGEVAHDFGNILSSISGNLHLLEQAEPERRRDLHNRLGAAVDLGTSLTERLLAFARKQHLAPQVTDVSELVTGMADLLEIAIPGQVSLVVDVPEAPVTCLVDPGQLESAILNLCINAGQAIAATGSGAGQIVVSVQAGDMVRVAVRDTGCGMSEEVLRHATDPFFTRKPDGSGTGLGLSMVDGFAHQSGGRLDIETATHGPSRGTTITLSFPRQDAPEVTPSGCGSVRALVVDDDPLALERSCVFLEAMGARVMRAASFAEAVEALKALDHLNLLLTDLWLDDGFSGRDLIVQACGHFPECQAALMSTRGAPADLPPNVLFVAKPVTQDAIRKIYSAVPGATPPASQAP